MEVMPGYKQTELGEIPADWHVEEVQDVANVKTGPFGSSLHEHDYVQVGTPIITVEHLSESGVIHSNLPMVSDIDKQRLKAYSLDKNDIVFSRVGSIDRNSLIRSTEAGWLFSGRLLRIRLNTKKVYAPYLSYHFHDEPFKQRVRNVAVGQTMPSLNTQIINGIKIIVPPLPEQHAIAATLSDTDALLSGLDTLIAKKQNIKQAAMQQLLTGQTRLPGFAGAWANVNLQDATISLDNLRVPLNEAQRDTMRGDYPYCGANGVLDYVNDYIIDDDIILIAEDGGYFDEYAYRPIAYKMTGKCWVNNHAHILKAKHGYSQNFIFYSLVHKNILSFLASGTRAKLNKSEMYKIGFDAPTDEAEQAAIAVVLSDMDAELAALTKRRNKTRALKQGMMQELLTGRTRLV